MTRFDRKEFLADRAATIPEVTHHRAKVNGTDLHYVRSGAEGSPVLLVHGFPESWWAFHRVIPRLAGRHQVIAVDMRGFGDSAHDDTAHASATLAADLLALVDHLALGPVHLVGQDISSTVTFRAALDQQRVRSYTAIEVGLPGHGLESAMDVTSGGSWHFGFFAAPGIAEMLLRGHEREFLTAFAYNGFVAVADAISDADMNEFVRVYSQPNGFRAASELYASMFRDGPELQDLGALPLKIPVLAIGAGANGGFGELAPASMRRLSNDVRSVVVAESGHFVAMEAPERLSGLLLEFFDEVESSNPGSPRPGPTAQAPDDGLSKTDWVREQTERILRTGTTDGVTVLDSPVVLVTTIGAKSGKKRYVPIMRGEHNGSYVMIASHAGAPTNPAWYHNLLAHPEVEVQDGTTIGTYIARELFGPERQEWWDRSVAVFPTLAEFGAKTTRVIPVFVLEPKA